jgi:uncharacterized membrane protein
MLLKKIGLVAVLTATLITGGAAVANAESGVGIGGPQSATDEAALQRNYSNGAWAGRNSYGYAQNSYGYAPEYGLGHSSRKHARANTRMKHKN